MLKGFFSLSPCFTHTHRYTHSEKVWCYPNSQLSCCVRLVALLAAGLREGLLRENRDSLYIRLTPVNGLGPTPAHTHTHTLSPALYRATKVSHTHAFTGTFSPLLAHSRSHSCTHTNNTQTNTGDFSCSVIWVARFLSKLWLLGATITLGAKLIIFAESCGGDVTHTVYIHVHKQIPKHGEPNRFYKLLNICRGNHKQEWHLISHVVTET